MTQGGQKLIAALVLVLWGVSAAAGPAGAPMRGVVFDPSGAVVPGAVVVLKGRDGALLREGAADAQGAFFFEGLAAGGYEVEVRHAGFKAFTRRVAVDGRPRPPLKVVLEIAGIAEEVTVGRDGPSMTTSSRENGDAVRVDQSLLQGIPVFDQDYIAALSTFLDQGAVDSAGVSLVVDGAEANRVVVSPSAIQEVKINENPYSAEYSRPGRGRIEVITKQGSPEYHGTFNFILRDSRLNARDAFAPEKAPEQRRIYEGYLSGPVGRGKTTSFQISVNRREEDLQSIVVAKGPDGEIRQNVPTPQRNTEASARLTRQFGPKHTLWAAYALEERAATNQGAGGFTLPEAAANQAYHEDDLDLNDQLTISPKMMNQLSLHFEWNHGSTTSVNSGTRIVVQDAFTAGGAQADQRSTEMDVKIFDAFSWSFGKHLIKAGVQATEWSHRTYDDLGNRGGTFFFSSLPDYEQGRPYAFTAQAGNGFVPLFQQIAGGFLQDEVRLSPKLSVALGARYDYQNLIHDGHLAARLFSAFAPGKTGAIVLRGGLGVFSDRFPPSTAADLVRYDGRHLDSYLLLDPSYPRVAPGPGAFSAAPANLARLDPTVRTPYTVQYSLGGEWHLAATTVAATYRGSRSVALLRSRDVNAPLPPDHAGRPDPTLGRVRQVESAGRQAGDALELSFRGKVGKAFTGLAQYTLSRTHNNTSGAGYFPANSDDPLADWGAADFDQRHRFNLLGTLDLRGFVKLGVGLSAASGKPYTLTTGRDDNRDGFTTDRPAGVGRNTLRAPGFADLDLQLSRNVHLDRAKGEKGPMATIGLGVFNALNTTSETTIVGNQSSPFFGQAVAARPSRRVQLSARFGF
jgi:hypothetical protein